MANYHLERMKIVTDIEVDFSMFKSFNGPQLFDHRLFQKVEKL